MTQTLARIKKAGKNFEIMVDMEKALSFKKGEGSEDFLEMDKIFSDSKKGEVSPNSDLKEAFQTEDVNEISEKIVKNGEVLVSQEQRSEEQEKNVKQVIDFLTTNSINDGVSTSIPDFLICSLIHRITTGRLFLIF